MTVVVIVELNLVGGRNCDRDRYVPVLFETSLN